MAESVVGCPDEDEVVAFVAGELGGLPSERRAEILAHVDGCDACRTLTAALAKESGGHPTSQGGGPVSLHTNTVVDGRFRLDKPLGKGAMGTVFRAHDLRLDVDVALKLVKKAAANEKSFARELNAGRRVTHPNVCRVYDAGSFDGFDYITMELIDGETLADLITREDLPLRRGAAVIDAICAGLAEAHARGIVHRDLKPANVMIERATGRVVLTDFGVATDLSAGESYRLVGTPQYWPPEQARGEPASPASDVYSLGVIAYRVLTGRELKLSDRDARGGVPRAFRGVLERCLEHRPAERYADAGEAREAFAAAAKSAARPIGARAALAVVGVAAVGVALYAFGRRHEAAAPPAEPTSATVDTSSATPTRAASSTEVVATAPPSAEPPVASASAAPTAAPAPVATRGVRGAHPPATVRAPASASAPAPRASVPKPADSDILYVH